MAKERTVAGLRCGQVLEHLSDYLDGDLDDATRTQIEAHLRGCDWCERFGAEFAGTIVALRKELVPVSPPQDVTVRLMQRLNMPLDKE